MKIFVRTMGVALSAVFLFSACSSVPSASTSAISSTVTADSSTSTAISDATDSDFVFADTIVFSESERIISIDLEKSAPIVKEKYEAIDTIFSSLPNLDRIAVGTASTANLLHQLGISVIAAPESPTLNPELTNAFYTAGEEMTEEKSVLNIGSMLSPNIEAVVELGPDIFFYSDAMPHSDSFDAMADLGVNVQPFAQRSYIDMIILTSVLKNYVGSENTKPQEYLAAMKSDLAAAQALVDAYSGEKKTAAILQKMPKTAYINGNSSVLGEVLTVLNVENSFADAANTELNMEALVEANPEYLILYGMGVPPDMLLGYIQEISAAESQLSSMDAVKNGNVFYVGNEEFTFAASVDLTITKSILLIANQIYGS